MAVIAAPDDALATVVVLFPVKPIPIPLLNHASQQGVNLAARLLGGAVGTTIYSKQSTDM